jgi:hypothetical protein
MGAQKTRLWRLNSHCEHQKLRCGGSISVVAMRNCSGATQFPLWTHETAQGRVIFRCEHENFCCGGSNRVVGSKNRIGEGEKS